MKQSENPPKFSATAYSTPVVRDTLSVERRRYSLTILHGVLAWKQPSLRVMKALLSILLLVVVNLGLATSISEHSRAAQIVGHVTGPGLQDQPAGTVHQNEDVKGPQHWAILMCKFADVGAEPQGNAFFEGMFERTDGPSLSDFWQEVSYGNIPNVTADAFGWFTLPNGRNHYGFSESTPGFEVTPLVQDCVNAADAAVDFSNTDAVAVMLNSPSPVAITTLWPINYPDGAQIWFGAIAIPSNKFNLALVAHEMGHAYGLPHSFANGQEYQNPWDLMGISSGYRCSVNADPVYSCLGQHTIAKYKDDLGWIPAARKFEAPQGESTITLERLALPQTDNYLVATISAGITTYYVEARQRVGYDAKLAGDAVLIHRGDDLVDADGSSPYDDEGAMWRPGETFTDEANGISVAVDSATTSGYVITINNGNEPVTPEMTAQLSADPAAPDANGRVDFQAAIIYQDPGFGTAENVMITVTLPSELTYVAGSLTTLPGTVMSEDPLVVKVDALLSGAPVLMSYAATVDGSVAIPTVIQVPVQVSWNGGSATFYHTLVANGLKVYLPTVMR